MNMFSISIRKPSEWLDPTAATQLSRLLKVDMTPRLIWWARNLTLCQKQSRFHLLRRATWRKSTSVRLVFSPQKVTQRWKWWKPHLHIISYFRRNKYFCLGWTMAQRHCQSKWALRPWRKIRWHDCNAAQSFLHDLFDSTGRHNRRKWADRIHSRITQVEKMRYLHIYEETILRA